MEQIGVIEVRVVEAAVGTGAPVLDRWCDSAQPEVQLRLTADRKLELVTGGERFRVDLREVTSAATRLVLAHRRNIGSGRPAVPEVSPIVEPRWPEIEAVVRATAEAARLLPAEITGRARDHRSSAWRHAAIAVCHQRGISISVLTRAFGRDRHTVSYALQRVAERRNPAVAAALARISARADALLREAVA